MEDNQESFLLSSNDSLEVTRIIIKIFIDNTLYLITELEFDKNDAEEVILIKDSHFYLDT
jgi:hypothetical protein